MFAALIERQNMWAVTVWIWKVTNKHVWTLGPQLVAQSFRRSVIAKGSKRLRTWSWRLYLVCVCVFLSPSPSCMQGGEQPFSMFTSTSCSTLPLAQNQQNQELSDWTLWSIRQNKSHLFLVTVRRKVINRCFGNDSKKAGKAKYSRHLW